MTTIIEKTTGDSPATSALAIVLIISVLLAAGLGIAYMNGAFNSSPTPVVEKNTTVIERNTTVLPAPVDQPVTPEKTPEQNPVVE